MTYCDIRTIKDLYFKLSDPRDLNKMSIERNRSAYAETEKLSLPPLISSPNDVWSFKWTDSEPNYVTQNEVTAKVVSFLSREAIANKIVLIPNADPGFDWIFECGIVGLITAWGGANSHMAIRASEMGLPAVIGIGENCFRSCLHQIPYSSTVGGDESSNQVNSHLVKYVQADFSCV